MRYTTVLVLVLSLGCSSLSPAEKMYVGAGVADLATTAYGMEEYGLTEGNRVMTHLGDDTASVVVSGLLVKAGAFFPWAMALGMIRVSSFCMTPPPV